MSAMPGATAPPDVAPWPAHAERLLRLVYRTSAAARQLRRALASSVARWELGDSEALILWLCWHPGPAGKVQGELATALGISPAQTSALVEGLRKRGLLEQQRSTLDRRRQVWRLTDRGDALLGELGPAVTELADELETKLAGGEQQQAEAMNERLAEALSDRPRLRTFPNTSSEAFGQGGCE